MKLPPLLKSDLNIDNRNSALSAILEEVLLQAQDHHGASSLEESSDSPSGAATNLVLSGCGITATDMNRIGEVLRIAQHIHTLDLRDTLVDEPLLRAIVQHVSINKAIVNVALDGDVADALSNTGEDSDANTSVERSEQLHVCSRLRQKLKALCQSNAVYQHDTLQKDNARHMQRLHKAQQERLRTAVAELILLEESSRRNISSDEAAGRKAMTEQKRTGASTISSIVRKKMAHIAQQRAVEQFLDRESAERAAVCDACLCEILLLVEADCGLQRRFTILEEADVRIQRKKEETQDWVLTRRKEKQRWAAEKEDRNRVADDESSARAEVLRELDLHHSNMELLFAQSLSSSQEAETARVDRIRREEAARKRSEDLARERAEKEEAQRQKALREYLLKQQQAREKLEADAGMVRKSIRNIENAMFLCVTRTAGAWLAYLGSRLDLERATIAYCSLLREPPVAALTMSHQYSATSPEDGSVRAQPHIFVADGGSEWLQVVAPSNFSSPGLNAHQAAASHHLPKLISIRLPKRDNGESETPPPERHASTQSSPRQSREKVTGVSFTFKMREAWVNAIKSAQQDFRTRLSKMESAKQATKVKVGEELKLLRLAVSQHRAEYSRWKQIVFVGGAVSPQLPSSPAGKLSSAPSLVVSQAADYSSSSPADIDPLDVDSADDYIRDVCHYGRGHSFLVSYIALQLEEDDLRTQCSAVFAKSSLYGGGPLSKEPSIATLKSIKEGIMSCKVECAVEVHTGDGYKKVATDYLKFELPSQSSFPGWDSSAPQPSQRFVNPFLLPSRAAVASFRFGQAHFVSSARQLVTHCDRSTLSGAAGTLPLCSDAVAVMQALVRQRRLEIEAQVETLKEMGSTDAIDYTAVANAKQVFDHWHTANVSQAVAAEVLTKPDDDDDVSGFGDVTQLLSRVMQLAEFTHCNEVQLRYSDLEAAQHETAREQADGPEGTDDALPEGDGAQLVASDAPLSAEPSVAPAAVVELESTGKAIAAHGEMQSRRSASVCEALLAFLSSLEYYATSNSEEGLRRVRVDLTVDCELDMSQFTLAFIVLRHLSQSSDLRSGDLRVSQCVGFAIPIAVVQPRATSQLTQVTEKTIVTTKADTNPIKGGLHSGFNQPQRLFHLRDPAPLAALIPPVVEDGEVRQSPLRYLGLELHVVITHTTPKGATSELQLCFASDSTLWFVVQEHAGAKRERSPYGTIFYSPSNNGQKSVALLDVLSGSVVSCGTPPLSLSAATAGSNVVAAMKRLARKSSTNLSGRKQSTPGSARLDTKSTVALRVESPLLTPELLSLVIARMSIAAAPAASFSSMRSLPTTPRSEAQSSAPTSAMHRVEVYLRVPFHASASCLTARETDGSLAVTPRDESSAFTPHALPMPTNGVWSPRVYRMDAPLAVSHVELLPSVTASPRLAEWLLAQKSTCNALALPAAFVTGKYVDVKNVYLTRSTVTVHPLRGVAIRILQEDSSTLDPSIQWSLTLWLHDDERGNNTTPMLTSRDDGGDSGVAGIGSAPHSPRNSNDIGASFCIGASLCQDAMFLLEDGADASAKAIFVRSSFVSRVLGIEAELPEHVPIGTLKSDEFRKSCCADVSIKLLWDSLKNAVDPVIGPSVLRFAAAYLLERLLQSITVQIDAADDSDTFCDPRSFVVDLDVKFRLDEDQKPAKQAKKKGSAVAADAMSIPQYFPLASRAPVAVFTVLRPVVQHNAREMESLDITIVGRPGVADSNVAKAIVSEDRHVVAVCQPLADGRTVSLWRISNGKTLSIPQAVFSEFTSWPPLHRCDTPADLNPSCSEILL